MQPDFHADDLARLLALEHALCAMTLISAGNYAYLADVPPSQAVRQFRDAIESSMFDSGSYPEGLRDAMHRHTKRIFEHIEQMAKHADKGISK